MSKLGIQCVMYAKRDKTGKYDGAKDISTLVQFNGAPNNITAEDFGDNRAVLSHRSTNKINLSMELNDMAGKEYADICGHQYDEETKKVTIKSTDTSPYIGIGAIGNSEKEDGSEVFIMKMYKKTQFSEPNDDNSTQTDTVEYKHVSLEGTCYPDETDGMTMKIEQEFETLELAKAELTKLLQAGE